jgi:bifunctional non-homologous end joining protein LigD
MAARSSLARYKAKRHFDRTPEPKPGRLAHADGHAYLIQKHDATRLHYDFRLEMDGVLKSWAVTKGPSLDPAVKRLAVHVEDHPLAYGRFEGTIPKGQYGGGTVMLWDRGDWEPQEPHRDPRADYEAGKLKFVLNGERLKGGWTLVRMRGRPQDKGRDNWLLIKERDEYARPGEGDAQLEDSVESVVSGRTMNGIAEGRDSRVWNSNRADGEAPRQRARLAPKVGALSGAKQSALPKFVEPELATSVAHPPEGEDWLHEIKIDGYRVYCRRDGDAVHLLTRSGQDWTARFGAVAEAVRRLPGKQFALDGEIAVLNEKGQSSFADLQEALSDARDDRLSLVAFDLLYLDGKDVRGAPLAERKRLLRALIPPKAETATLRYSDHVQARGAELFEHASKLHYEGIVSKRAKSPYRSGRGGDWLKSKCLSRQEFVIGGYTLGEGARKGGVGALLLGHYEGDELRYAGRVGTGFTTKLAGDLLERLQGLKIAKPAFAAVPAEGRAGAIWVKPELVCEVEFSNWTHDDVIRHASYQGLREDKPAKAVHRDRVGPASVALKSGGGTKKAATGANVVAGVTISHPDRKVFPDIGVTKLELARYYEAVAPAMLAELANRPLSLLRCPEGLAGECFFQKHFEHGVKNLKRVAIEEKHGTSDYVWIRDAKDLVSLIQEGVIELHPWGARADNPDAPDRLIFDLDPAPELRFAAVIDAAKRLRKLLDGIGLVSFTKTTGGKGLHVVVPLRRNTDWPTAKNFSQAVALLMVEKWPDDFTANPLKKERHGKIFVDYLRNDRGSTAVAAYSVRARPGAPVAMPIRWEELKAGFRANKFSLRTVPKLLEARRQDPWAAIGSVAQSIPAALKALGQRG